MARRFVVKHDEDGTVEYKPSLGAARRRAAQLFEAGASCVTITEQALAPMDCGPRCRYEWVDVRWHGEANASFFYDADGST